MKEQIGLFVGRFQPFHVGHFSVINEMAEKVDKIKIGIGSSQYHHTKDNPFTFEERSEMINKTIEYSKVKIGYSIYNLPDIYDYNSWPNHVKEIVGKFDVVFSGNDIVKKLFEKDNVEISPVATNTYISSTEIRKMIFKGGKWQQYLPKGTLETVVECGGVERIKNLYKEFKSPSPTVDLIIKTPRGVVLIERKHEPFGWALPGGYLDYNETLEEGAVREGKEETSLDVGLVKQFHTYSDPKRDIRQHNISTVFIAEIIGNANDMKARDDAKNIGIFPLDKLPKLAFDHKKILDDYRNNKY